MDGLVKDQKVTDNYAIYNSDCMFVMPSLADASIDLSVYSPPFAGLYNYSSSPNDFSNCDSKEKFLDQYEMLIAEIARVTKPGRITAVHCTDVMDSKTERLWDFPHEVIRLHEKYGFHYRNRITVWKEPLKVRMRTMVKSLMHKMIVEDSTQSFTAMPDYVLVFKRDGDSEVPVTHPRGLKHYFGDMPMLIDHLSIYGIECESIRPAYEESQEKATLAQGIRNYILDSFNSLKDKYFDFDEEKDHKLNKLSHMIWRRYASSVWDDVRIDNVLPFRDSKEDDDEKHVHPLQLDVIDRIVTLYSNEGETVLTPFMGVGSEVYSPVSLGRKAIGIELKDSYYKQAVINLSLADKRFDEKLKQENML